MYKRTDWNVDQSQERNLCHGKFFLANRSDFVQHFLLALVDISARCPCTAEQIYIYTDWLSHVWDIHYICIYF